MLTQTHCNGPQLVNTLRVNATPSVEEWANEPRPDGPLVICEIARPQVTEILGLIVRVTRRQRPQSIWSEQLIMHDVDDRLPILLVQNRMRQRNAE
jgi:hypothetical protein